MKILQIIDTLGSGGRERQLLEVLKFFSKKKDVTCEIITMSKDVHYDYVIESLNIKKYSVIRIYKKDPSIFYKFYKIFKESKPDIIHSWGAMCSFYAMPAAKLLHIKFINGFLRNAPLNQSLKDPGWIISKLTFPFSDLIVANSYAGLKAHKVSSVNSTCFHNGFDFLRVQKIENKKSVKNKYNIMTEYVVGMVATFSENKDYITLIKAANLVLEERKDVTFVLIGDGDNFLKILNMIKPEYRPYIRLLGKQKRVLNIVNIFDIGILSTYTEGISNSIMEYMALKKPVIATDCGGNRELVKNNVSGFLVKPNNPMQLQNNIYLLLDSPKLAEEMGKNGYKKLKNEFNLERMGNNFYKYYRILINR